MISDLILRYNALPHVTIISLHLFQCQHYLFLWLVLTGCMGAAIRAYSPARDVLYLAANSSAQGQIGCTIHGMSGASARCDFHGVFVVMQIQLVGANSPASAPVTCGQCPTGLLPLTLPPPKEIPNSHTMLLLMQYSQTEQES